MNISAKRLEGETLEDYKARRKAAHKAEKAYLRGRRVKHTRKELRAIVGEITHPQPLPRGD